ncbi:hypothetical protein [Tessaracoccus sp.]
MAQVPAAVALDPATTHALECAARAGAPAAVLDLIRAVDAHMDEQFPNVCVAIAATAREDGDESGGMVHLWELSDEEFADGNCYKATHHIKDVIIPTLSQEPGVTHDAAHLDWVVAPDSDPEQHWANLVTSEGAAWVVDYTARQFNTSLPFPYVAVPADWKRVIDGCADTQYTRPFRLVYESTVHLHEPAALVRLP